MGKSEDELANSLIKSHKASQQRVNETSPDSYDVRAYPEAHYNHYGNRGVADLYVAVGDWDGDVYELKSESAVREVTGANAILRQFNKMREFFFPGSSHDPPTHSLRFELCFTPTEYNIRHLADNAGVYRSAVEQQISDVRTDKVLSTITMRPANPEEAKESGSLTPVSWFTPSYSPYEEDFVKHFKESQPDIFEEYADTIREVA